MKRLSRFFLSAIFLTSWAGTATARQVKFTSYRLANGLRVVLAPDAAESGVAVNLSFDAGSWAESRAQAGAARVLQGIVLRNPPRPTGGGEPASLEGVVNQERTSYFSEFDAGRFELMLEAFARLMRAPDLGRAQVDEQRAAILGECGRLGERRFGRAEEALLQLIYRDLAYRHGASCSGPELNQLSPGAVGSFFKTFYVPNNAVLVIVGNFRTEAARRLVAKHFGAVTRRAVVPVAGHRNLRFSLERRRTLSAPPAHPPTYLSAYLTVPSNHRDWYALNILADIIGQGDAARLHAALVARGLATSVPEGVAESRGQSLFRIGAALSPAASVEKVEAVIDAEIARLQSEGVTQAEVDRARLQEREYSAGQLRSPRGRASFLARSTLYYNDPDRVNTELGRLLAVTAEDVRRVARKYLVKTRRAVVIARPAPST
jgi:zinc protease